MKFKAKHKKFEELETSARDISYARSLGDALTFTCQPVQMDHQQTVNLQQRNQTWVLLADLFQEGIAKMNRNSHKICRKQ